MTNSFFHNNEFEINGITVPEFDLKRGKLIRIYAPFAGMNNSVLGHNLTKKLIKRFQSQKSNFPFTENYQKNIISEFINPLTVRKYLNNKMRVEKQVGKRILEEILLVI